MKRIIKSRVFAFILGAVIFGGIVGVSAYSIFANDIGYTPSDSTWKKSNGEDITNVKDAIDELYSKANEGKTATQVATLTTQGAIYTMQNDGYIIGTAKAAYMSASACIYFNGTELKDIVFAVPHDNSNTLNVSLYVRKDTIVYTRSDYGTYNLTVYEWK